jgi:predicted metal-dependent hydrolase
MTTANGTEYDIIRSNRRTVALQITRECAVLVRAPRRMTNAEIDRFVTAHADWIEKHLGAMRGRMETHPEPTEAERAACAARAGEVLPERVRFYSELMKLVPTGITITGAKTRFGSCSGKNKLCFSWRLMQYPDAAIDYVVVHELAHIRHKNHGKDFYALIASVLPDYKARKKLLRE